VKEKIKLGHAIENRVVQDKIREVPYPDLLHSLLIAGMEGVGKSYFFAYFLQEIGVSHPKVGILVLKMCERSPAELIHCNHTLTVDSRKKSLNQEEEMTMMENWISGDTICLDLSKLTANVQRRIFLTILRRIKEITNHNDYQSPKGFIAIDDADKLLEAPETDQVEFTFGEERDLFIRKTEFTCSLEQLMYFDLKQRGFAFIIVCRDPSRVYRFILERSKMKMFFRLKAHWIVKIREFL
jgi:hypothetical protein